MVESAAAAMATFTARFDDAQCTARALGPGCVPIQLDMSEGNALTFILTHLWVPLGGGGDPAIQKMNGVGTGDSQAKP